VRLCEGRYLLAFMASVSLGFLAGLQALSPNSSLKRRFMVDVLTSAPVSNIIWSSLCWKWWVSTPPTSCHVIISLAGNLEPNSPVQILKTTKRFLTTAWWSAVLLNYSFFDIFLFEYPSSCIATILTSPQLKNIYFADVFRSKTCHNFDYFLFPRQPDGYKAHSQGYIRSISDATMFFQHKKQCDKANETIFHTCSKNPNFEQVVLNLSATVLLLQLTARPLCVHHLGLLLLVSAIRCRS